MIVELEELRLIEIFRANRTFERSAADDALVELLVKLAADNVALLAVPWLLRPS